MKHWHLYVLRLEQGKWYVGITTKTPGKRFYEHKNQIRAAAWTKKYKPLKIHDTRDLGVCEKRRAESFERKVTLEYMKKWGDNNVRGGNLTHMGDYSRHFGKIFLKQDLREGAGALVAAMTILYLMLLLYFALLK